MYRNLYPKFSFRSCLYTVLVKCPVRFYSIFDEIGQNVDGKMYFSTAVTTKATAQQRQQNRTAAFSVRANGYAQNVFPLWRGMASSWQGLRHQPGCPGDENQIQGACAAASVCVDRPTCIKMSQGPRVFVPFAPPRVHREPGTGDDEAIVTSRGNLYLPTTILIGFISPKHEKPS